MHSNTLLPITQTATQYSTLWCRRSDVEAWAHELAKYCSCCKRMNATRYLCDACSVNLCLPSANQRSGDGTQRNCFYEWHLALSKKKQCAPCDDDDGSSDDNVQD